MFGKQILIKGVETVVFLFAAFGHLFLNIAPPTDYGISNAVGISEMFVLSILFLITYLAKNLQKSEYKRSWFKCSIVLIIVSFVISILYISKLDQYTFLYPSKTGHLNKYVKGTTFTDKAEKYYVENNKEVNLSKMVADFGGPQNKNLIWTSDSIEFCNRFLSISYMALIIFYSSSIFSLIEGLLGKT